MPPRPGSWFRFARDEEQTRRVDLLSQVSVFSGLSRRFLGRLSALLFEKTYEPDEIVFEEGEPGRGLFVVVEGSVSILRLSSRGEQVLSTLGPGSCFGELALIDELPRSATARVRERSRLLILYRTDFEALVASDRAVALAVMRNLLRTLSAYVRRTNAALAEHGVTPGESTAELRLPRRAELP